MSNKILTHKPSLERLHFTPITNVQYDLYDGPLQNMYIFISKGYPWTNNEIESIQNSSYYDKKIHKDIIALKKINVNDIFPIIERIDWEANTFYDYYSHSVDLFERDPTTNKLIKKFYVKNKYDQVFKCIWNNKNYANSFSVSNIITANNYKSISHTGGTYEIGSYIRLYGTNPEEFNGTYKVISSSLGLANVAYGNAGSYIITTSNTYISGGSIKCAELSSEMPYFDVGTTDDNDIITLSDGYKWKYIFTVNPGIKQKFYNENWIPIPIQFSLPEISTIGFGQIDIINIISTGNNYENGIGTVTINIVGDGENATADTFVYDNKLSVIEMTAKGSNYTTAIAEISSSSGSGAEIELSISPIGGHGYDIIKEFDCKNIMITSSITNDETPILPTDITYYQYGILYNPIFTSTDAVYRANNSFYTTFDVVNVGSSISNYTQGESVYQGESTSNYTFLGKVISFDDINNILYVTKLAGAITENYSLVGASSSTSRVVLNNSESEIVPYSGTIYYTNNNDGIERNSLGEEQIRIILSF